MTQTAQYLPWRQLDAAFPERLSYMTVYIAARRGHIRAKRISRPAGMTRGRKLIAFHAGDVARWLADDQAHKAGPKPVRVNGRSKTA